MRVWESSASWRGSSLEAGFSETAFVITLEAGPWTTPAWASSKNLVVDSDGTQRTISLSANTTYSPEQLAEQVNSAFGGKSVARVYRGRLWLGSTIPGVDSFVSVSFSDPEVLLLLNFDEQEHSGRKVYVTPEEEPGTHLVGPLEPLSPETLNRPLSALAFSLDKVKAVLTAHEVRPASYVPVPSDYISMDQLGAPLALVLEAAPSDVLQPGTVLTGQTSGATVTVLNHLEGSSTLSVLRGTGSLVVGEDLSDGLSIVGRVAEISPDSRLRAVKLPKEAFVGDGALASAEGKDLYKKLFFVRVKGTGYPVGSPYVSPAGSPHVPHDDEGPVEVGLLTMGVPDDGYEPTNRYAHGGVLRQGSTTVSKVERNRVYFAVQTDRVKPGDLLKITGAVVSGRNVSEGTFRIEEVKSDHVVVAPAKKAGYSTTLPEGLLIEEGELYSAPYSSLSAQVYSPSYLLRPGLDSLGSDTTPYLFFDRPLPQGTEVEIFFYEPRDLLSKEPGRAEVGSPGEQRAVSWEKRDRDGAYSEKAKDLYERKQLLQKPPYAALTVLYDEDNAKGNEALSVAATRTPPFRDHTGGAVQATYPALLDRPALFDLVVLHGSVTGAISFGDVLTEPNTGSSVIYLWEAKTGQQLCWRPPGEPFPEVGTYGKTATDFVQATAVEHLPWARVDLPWEVYSAASRASLSVGSATVSITGTVPANFENIRPGDWLEFFDGPYSMLGSQAAAFRIASADPATGQIVLQLPVPQGITSARWRVVPDLGPRVSLKWSTTTGSFGRARGRRVYLSKASLPHQDPVAVGLAVGDYVKATDSTSGVGTGASLQRVVSLVENSNTLILELDSQLVEGDITVLEVVHRRNGLLCREFPLYSALPPLDHKDLFGYGGAIPAEGRRLSLAYPAYVRIPTNAVYQAKGGVHTQQEAGFSPTSLTGKKILFRVRFWKSVYAEYEHTFGAEYGNLWDLYMGEFSSGLPPWLGVSVDGVGGPALVFYTKTAGLHAVLEVEGDGLLALGAGNESLSSEQPSGPTEIAAVFPLAGALALPETHSTGLPCSLFLSELLFEARNNRMQGRSLEKSEVLKSPSDSGAEREPEGLSALDLYHENRASVLRVLRGGKEKAALDTEGRLRASRLASSESANPKMLVPVRTPSFELWELANVTLTGPAGADITIGDNIQVFDNGDPNTGTVIKKATVWYRSPDKASYRIRLLEGSPPSSATEKWYKEGTTDTYITGTPTESTAFFSFLLNGDLVTGKFAWSTIPKLAAALEAALSAHGLSSSASDDTLFSSVYSGSAPSARKELRLLSASGKSSSWRADWKIQERTLSDAPFIRYLPAPSAFGNEAEEIWQPEGLLRVEADGLLLQSGKEWALQESPSGKLSLSVREEPWIRLYFLNGVPFAPQKGDVVQVSTRKDPLSFKNATVVAVRGPYRMEEAPSPWMLSSDRLQYLEVKLAVDSSSETSGEDDLRGLSALVKWTDGGGQERRALLNCAALVIDRSTASIPPDADVFNASSTASGYVAFDIDYGSYGVLFLYGESFDPDEGRSAWKLGEAVYWQSLLNQIGRVADYKPIQREPEGGLLLELSSKALSAVVPIEAPRISVGESVPKEYHEQPREIWKLTNVIYAGTSTIVEGDILEVYEAQNTAGLVIKRALVLAKSTSGTELTLRMLDGKPPASSNEWWYKQGTTDTYARGEPYALWAENQSALLGRAIPDRKEKRATEGYAVSSAGTTVYLPYMPPKTAFTQLSLDTSTPVLQIGEFEEKWASSPPGVAGSSHWHRPVAFTFELPNGPLVVERYGVSVHNNTSLPLYVALLLASGSGSAWTWFDDRGTRSTAGNYQSSFLHWYAVGTLAGKETTYSLSGHFGEAVTEIPAFFATGKEPAFMRQVDASFLATKRQEIWVDTGGGPSPKLDGKVYYLSGSFGGRIRAVEKMGTNRYRLICTAEPAVFPYMWAGKPVFSEKEQILYEATDNSTYTATVDVCSVYQDPVFARILVWLPAETDAGGTDLDSAVYSAFIQYRRGELR